MKDVFVGGNYEADQLIEPITPYWLHGKPGSALIVPGSHAELTRRLFTPEIIRKVLKYGSLEITLGKPDNRMNREDTPDFADGLNSIR